jgi:hypothetical protein
MEFLLGSKKAVSNAPVSAFDDSRMHFLAELSRALLAHPSAKSLPDVVTFAYWCRQAHLMRLKQQYGHAPVLRMGLGMTFHICPSNVPVNFAFSMAFALLAGNTCVLRLPSKSTQTTELLLDALRMVLNRPSQSAMADALLLLRFDRDDAVNAFWMSVADGRIVWGGDQTVALMRGYPSKSRSREVAFSDRYSLCVIDPNSILAMSPSELRQFCGHLFNDIYLMDQAACSSPQLVVWVGDRSKVQLAQSLLWPVLHEIAENKYVLQSVQAVDKYVEACRSAMNNQHIAHIERHGNVLYRVALDNIKDDQDVSIVNERYQTLTVQGLEPEDIRRWIIQNGLRGIDRVVPVGRALDMDIIWDGYDIVTTLSRTVVI